ncbi:ATP-dependent Clp protease ATP-binding subunit [Candidatus Peregrinibacteria bacterium]|nr:ATP-dependent Clp protease ATP-binding subunit [Candidatus Peregrinibacteria bacterium]MBT4055529.1 ATP-dependent Clp protease ATP-binding subunit [Candidatus Peregrinibacteria bacterium]
MLDGKFDKFTKEARQALVVSQEYAKDSGQSYVGTEHMLLGILTQENSLGASVLINFGVSTQNVELVLKSVGRVGQSDSDAGPGGLSTYAKNVIENSLKAAQEYGHSFVGTEHLLYSLVAQENTAATVILENMRINPNDIKDQIIEIFERSKEAPAANGAAPQNSNPLELFLNGLHGVLAAGQVQKDQMQDAYKHKDKDKDKKDSKTPALDYFTSDLCQEARDGKLSPVVGRKKEIERVVSILCRKTKNNPVLIGEPGVGKTAVAEGLAQAIITGEVPENMLDKKILSLSMTSVVAGTKYRGEFEERMKQIVDELSSLSDVILFIDELHTVIGAGSAEGSLDAANILKPALSRSKVQVIGATTTKEYRKHIENDAALERRFQPVMVEEPSEADTILMLRGLQEGFEDHHNLVITEEAIEAAVRLSKRYVNDRQLPDKAIDLIDEASSLKRIKTKSTDSDKLKKLQKKLQSIIKKKEECVSRQDYEKAAELRNEELDASTQIEAQKKTKVPRSQRKKIGEEDIAKVIASMTGVPATKLVKDDVDKLQALEEALKKRIVGQDEAIEAISKAIRRSRAGIADEKRPIGSFIFMGPTGVGKTELVKAIAEEVYNDRNALIKIDMSEFMERHNTSRLVGATAGYVGYDEGGQLTDAVRSKPYSVILFDEIEKAHTDVFNLLLQILEDGELTDAKGRKVNFKNTIIIMTSNIGAEKLTEKASPMGFGLKSEELKEAEKDYDATKEDLLNSLKEKFRPEFLNRVDKLVVFRPLTHDHIKEIVKLHLGYLNTRLSHRKIDIELTSGGLEYLAQKGYDPAFGARPVRRAIQEYVEDPLTQKVIDGVFKEGDSAKVVKKGEGIDLTKIVKKTAAKKTKAKK